MVAGDKGWSGKIVLKCANGAWGNFLGWWKYPISGLDIGYTDKHIHKNSSIENLLSEFIKTGLGKNSYMSY